jgi:hypothetical protein
MDQPFLGPMGDAGGGFCDMAVRFRRTDLTLSRVPIADAHRVGIGQGGERHVDQANADPARPPIGSAALGNFPRQAARCGVAIAGVLVAVALTAVPATARAGGPGTGAAIGLGILGGVIAGTAIAATTPPVYAAPPSYYYYPQQGYYYNTPAPHNPITDRRVTATRPTITNNSHSAAGAPRNDRSPASLAGGRAHIGAHRA